jgi:hypothetical protein
MTGYRRRDEVDFMEELAVPLPVTVIRELLRVDPARRREPNNGRTISAGGATELSGARWTG